MNPSTQKPMIIITGAAGNLGQALVGALKQDYRIIGLDRKSADGVAKSFSIDLTAPKSVKDTFQQLLEEEGDEVAAVIHLYRENFEVPDLARGSRSGLRTGPTAAP